MHLLRHPGVSVALVVTIGILCGFLFGLLARRAGAARRAAPRVLTSALVGLAGAFLGFHAAMLSNLAAGYAIVPYVAAAAISAAVLWGWRAAQGSG